MNPAMTSLLLFSPYANYHLLYGVYVMCRVIKMRIFISNTWTDGEN